MIEEAIEKYNFVNPTSRFVRHNENITYCITDDNGQYVLRIHKPSNGFSVDFLRLGVAQDKFVESEIEVLTYLENTSQLGTQKVVRNKSGEPITTLRDGSLVTALEWVKGKTLENMEITNELAFRLGWMIGSVHKSMSKVKIENRYIYGAKMIDKLLEEVRYAIAAKHYDKEHGAIIIDTLLKIKMKMDKDKNRFSFVHADLGKSNLLLCNEAIVPIDFSLSGYCLPEMDLASIFSHINNDKLNKEILKGYESYCSIKVDEKAIQTCLSLQVLLFIICQHEKIYNQPWIEKSMERWCNDIFLPYLKN